MHTSKDEVEELLWECLREHNGRDGNGSLQSVTYVTIWRRKAYETWVAGGHTEKDFGENFKVEQVADKLRSWYKNRSRLSEAGSQGVGEKREKARRRRRWRRRGRC